jgi:DNA mismatch repair protein MutS2
MHFDKKNIKPTYQLNVGKPGSSFAFEIAQNTGLSKRVLNYARFKAGKNIKKIEELLVELQSDKITLEDKILSLKDKEIQLDKLTKRYEKMYKDLDFKKKKLKLEKKELSLINLNKDKKDVQNLIRKISRNNKIEEAKKLATALENKKRNILTETKSLNKIVHESTKSDWIKLKEGDYIKLKSGGVFGKILKISKNKAEIESGILTMTVPLHDLLPAKKPISINAHQSISTNIKTNSAKFETTIDIRGYSKTEAMDSLQDYFDSALLSDATLLKILHGKGNGILRNTVKQIASEYKNIEELWHPPIDQGGDGITFVKLV